jgi:hypothetical protein
MDILQHQFNLGQRTKWKRPYAKGWLQDFSGKLASNEKSIGLSARQKPESPKLSKGGVGISPCYLVVRSSTTDRSLY